MGVVLLAGSAVVVMYRIVHTGALAEWRGPAVAAGAGAGIVLLATMGLRSANNFQLQSVRWSVTCCPAVLCPVCVPPSCNASNCLLRLLSWAVLVLFLPGAVRGGRWSGGAGSGQFAGSKHHHHWPWGEC
jgi:hypothetical protein